MASFSNFIRRQSIGNAKKEQNLLSRAFGLEIKFFKVWTVACHVAHLYVTCIHHLVQKTGRKRFGEGWLNSVQNVFHKRCKLETLIGSLERTWLFILQFFAPGVVYTFSGGKVIGKPFWIFLLKMLSGETLCKFYQIFPPKDLVYRGKIFLHTFLII